MPMCKSARPYLNWQKSLGLGAWLVVFGCGGQVVEEPEGDGGQSGDGGTSGTGANGAGASASTPKDRLGDCVPGVPRAQATSCAWISESTCYPTKQAACNCICPLNVAEVYCLSDVPEAGFGTEVYCYAP